MNARSRKEIELYIEEHPCPVCGTRVNPADLPPNFADVGARMRVTHTGNCASCGNPLHYEFAVPREHPAGRFSLGDGPSEIFAADELLAIAERMESATPRDPAELDPDEYFRNFLQIGTATALVEDVLKTIPAGESEVPRDAFFGPRGTADRDASPARFQRVTLERQRDAYRALTDAYQAVNREMNARKAKLVKATPPPVELTKPALVAHKEWLARGKTGAGRLVAEGASVGPLGMSSAKLGGARLVKVRFFDHRVDFANLAEAELVECTGKGTNFTHAIFDGATLEACSFPKSHFGLTDFKDAKILGGDYQGSTADRGSWNRVRIKKADLRRFRFGDCILDGAVLEDCDLREADLHCISPYLATLCSTMNATFIRCDLRGANIDQRRFDNTRFVDCKLAGLVGTPRLEGATPYTLENCDFSPAGDGSDIRPRLG